MNPKPHLLVVEDEDNLRNLMVDWLQEAGYPVSQGADGAVALEILQSHKDKKYLLITDIKMPRLNGETLITEAINQGFEFISIIVITGEWYIGAGVTKLISEGKIYLLDKPFTKDDLLNLIKAVSP